MDRADENTKVGTKLLFENERVRGEPETSQATPLGVEYTEVGQGSAIACRPPATASTGRSW